MEQLEVHPWSWSAKKVLDRKLGLEFKIWKCIFEAFNCFYVKSCSVKHWLIFFPNSTNRRIRETHNHFPWFQNPTDNQTKVFLFPITSSHSPSLLSMTNLLHTFISIPFPHLHFWFFWGSSYIFKNRRKKAMGEKRN